MKVVLCGPYPVDLSRRAGVVSAVICLAQGLRQRSDIELHIVTVTKDVPEDKTVESDNATVHYLAVPKRRIVPNLIANIGRISRRIQQIQPDLVHSQAPIAALAGLRAGFPTVHTIHGISHKEVQFASGLGDKARVWLEGVWGIRAVRGVKHCISVSKYAVEAFDGMTNAKMHLIDNPIDDAFFSLRDKEEPHGLLFVGSVIERKNVLGHLEVVRQLVGKYPGMKLRIAGGTPDPVYYEQCRSFVAEHKLGGNVEFLGNIPVDRIVEENSRAAVFLLLSKQETAPAVIAEALGAGKPVVASTAGGNADLVKHGETGYVAPWDDTDAFAGYIDDLLSNDELRREMGRKAREDARQRFSIPVVTEQTIEVYKEAVAEA